MLRTLLPLFLLACVACQATDRASASDKGANGPSAPDRRDETNKPGVTLQNPLGSTLPPNGPNGAYLPPRTSPGTPGGTGLSSEPARTTVTLGRSGGQASASDTTNNAGAAPAEPSDQGVIHAGPRGKARHPQTSSERSARTAAGITSELPSGFGPPPEP